MYEMRARVRLSEADHNNILTIPGIVNYFQDCSTFQSEDLGLGLTYLESRRRVWIMNAWQIQISRYPAIGEKLTVGTWASGFEGLYGTRNFLMNDEYGDRIACANSIWVLMDLEKGHPVKPQEEDVALYGTEPPLDMEYAPRKISVPEELDAHPPVPVHARDIDTNEHVNNCRYIQMALEELPRDRKYTQVRAEYKKSAVLGDMIYPWISKEQGLTVVTLCDENKKPYAVVECR